MVAMLRKIWLGYEDPDADSCVKLKEIAKDEVSHYEALIDEKPYRKAASS